MVRRRQQDPEIEVIWDDGVERSRPSDRVAGGPRWVALAGGVILVVMGAVLGGWLIAAEDPEAGPPPEATTSPETTRPATAEQTGDAEVETPEDRLRREAVLLAESLPAPLIAAELYQAAPGPDTARSLLDSIGGVEGLVLGSAEGAFDVVTFDPADPGHLLASHRSSYGPAENQMTNEEWYVSGGAVTQTLFDPDVAHDFAHFNPDGSVAVWANSGNNDAFASRLVTVESEPGVLSFGPVYASRAVIVDETLFALTGSDDYYDPDRRFRSLVADRNGRQSVLDSGQPWSWIDSPAPNIMVAYPADDRGVTMVWDTSSLEQLLDHPLAGHNHQRLAVSGDGRTAVAVRRDGELEAIDMATGTNTARFGSLNPEGIAQPITLSHDGSIAITVDWDGTVTLWWIGHPQPLAVIDATAGPARVVAQHRAPRASSAVEPSGRRIAVRQPARPQTPMQWQILDTDLDNWVLRACDLAARILTQDERQRLGLATAPPACG